MPCIKKVYKTIDAGTLVSSQEQRAAVVPRMNRLSTADKPQTHRGFCSPLGLHEGGTNVLPKKRSDSYFSMPLRAAGTVVFWSKEPVGVLSCPVLPCPAVCCPAPARPDLPVVCSGFAFDKSIPKRQ